MAIQSSGTISFQDLEDEFNNGSSSTVSLADYVRGGSLVPDITDNNDIPTTTSNMSLDDFYGANNFSASLSGFFGSKFDVPTSSVQTSDSTVTVNISSGTLTGSISGSGGALKWSINGGSYSSSNRSVSNGNVIRVRQTASNNYTTSTTATFSLGGYDSETFTVTTEFAP